MKFRYCIVGERGSFVIISPIRARISGTEIENKTVFNKPPRALSNRPDTTRVRSHRVPAVSANDRKRLLNRTPTKRTNDGAVPRTVPERFYGRADFILNSVARV